MSDETRAALDAQLNFLRRLGSPGVCSCGEVLIGAELVRTRTSATPPRDLLEYQCAKCGRVSVFPYEPPAAPAVNRFTHCPTCGADGTQIHLHPDGPISPSAYRYICTACDTVIEGRRVFLADDAMTAVTLAADAVTLTIAGVALLPQGSVITVSVVVGPDGPVVIPPAETPHAEAEQPKKKRYINGD